MAVSSLEAVCRSEAQRVLTALRGTRRYGDLHKSWRELEESSPVRQLADWRCCASGAQYGRRNGAPAATADASVLVEAFFGPLLAMVRSAEFGGPATCVSLEAVRAALEVLCGGLGTGTASDLQDLGSVLTNVIDSVCKCAFEETNPQTDEATAMQMSLVLGCCCTVPLLRHGADQTTHIPAEERLRAFNKIVSLWRHYRLPTLRAGAQDALLRMLDFAVQNAESQEEFLRLVLDSISNEINGQLPADVAQLYVRCLQRLTMAAAPEASAKGSGPPPWVVEEAVPAALASIGDFFGTNVSVLSLLLPVVNRICWLCADRSCATTGDSSVDGACGGRRCGLGALQVEALIGRTYIRTLARAVMPLRPRSVAAAASNSGLPSGGLHGGDADAAVTLSVDEGAELLVVLLEALCDLLQPGFVWTLWSSFDADWRRPPLLEQVVHAIMVLFEDGPSPAGERERPLPAYVDHLSASVLTRIVVAFGTASGQGTALEDEIVSAEYARLREQWDRREALRKLMSSIEEKPKKARASVEKSPVLDWINLPPTKATGSGASPKGQSSIQEEDWTRKLAWVCRCCNYVLPYEALGEFFGQPTEDAEKAFQAFVDTFDWGEADIDYALRCFLQAFRLPKEAQQIDRVLKIFGDTYYAKHVAAAEAAVANGCSSTVYLRSADAAYTLAFSVIMLNTDQHNPRLKKRMQVKDFLNNNRKTNEGEDFPHDVQRRIFAGIAQDEIKTPASGSFVDGISRARLHDIIKLCEEGYRDNQLLRCSSAGSPAHLRGFLEQSCVRLKQTYETMLASDPCALSDAAFGLEELLRLATRHFAQEADSVAEILFLFGNEVFHEAQQRNGSGLGRAELCLRALFSAAAATVGSLSAKQTHVLVYLTVQFVLYGQLERIFAGEDADVLRLLRIPLFPVEPPTGVVYNFLRKISTVPFKMLAFSEEIGETGGASQAEPKVSPSASPTAGDGVRRTQTAPAAVQSPSSKDAASTSPAEGQSNDEAAAPPASAGGGDAGLVPTEEPLPVVPDSEASATSASPTASQSESAAAPSVGPSSATGGYQESSDDQAVSSKQDDPLRPQVERALEVCQLDVLLKALVAPWKQPTQEAGMPGPDSLLSFLSPLFLALRTAATRVPKDQDMPWWPEVESRPEMGAPQALQLPKRALALNVMDGYETLRLALRVALAAIWQVELQSRQEAGAGASPASAQRRPPLWEPSTMQEFCICAHVGLFHTLRRADLSERTLRQGIICTFRLGAMLLAARGPQGPVVTVGWPTRLLEVLVRRCETEPQLLVPVAQLCLEAMRDFVTEVSSHRAMDQVLLWQRLLQLLLKAVPTTSRALWPGQKDDIVHELQRTLWRRGIVWLLGHPALLECVGAEDGAQPEKGGAKGDNGSVQLERENSDKAAPAVVSAVGGAFWAWALGEMGALAEEMCHGSKLAASRLLVEIYAELLGSIIQKGEDPSDGSHEEGNTRRERRLVGQAAAWSKVVIHLLALVAPMLGRKAAASASAEAEGGGLIDLLRSTMLDIHVPPILSSAPQGPHAARQTLEKLVSVLTNGAATGAARQSAPSAPTSVLREAVPLVAKFFLQNLTTLQRNCNTPDVPVKPDESPNEHFRQIWLMVLRLMCSFVKRGQDDLDAELEEIATETLKNLLQVLLSTKALGFVPQGQTPSEDVHVWWQMTWNFLKISLPGFCENFARSSIVESQPSHDLTESLEDWVKYEVVVEKGDGVMLGCKIDLQLGLIEKVHADGLVATWNAENPQRQIQPQDRVIEVNGVRGDMERIVGEFKKTGTMKMVLARRKETTSQTAAPEPEEKLLSLLKAAQAVPADASSVEPSPAADASSTPAVADEAPDPIRAAAEARARKLVEEAKAAAAAAVAASAPPAAEPPTAPTAEPATDQPAEEQPAEEQPAAEQQPAAEHAPEQPAVEISAPEPSAPTEPSVEPAAPPAQATTPVDWD
eukprot:TRINITY_DN47198_c0_g1_i2.p1 TRINITY_DN47198_c0_g1~~TRINITY_DN47198_c0_g1_i2.p1  ORF type:complete len:1955 (+),score=517.24 TRINITY_DN47198_c0_g1_i2:173-6037(+)